jgi:maleamate amidohydrolase
VADRQGAFAGNLHPGKHPALLLVDPVQAYVEPGSPLFLESGAAAANNMAVLLREFRSRELPVIWTRVRYRSDGSDGGHFYKKVPALAVFSSDGPLGEFVQVLAPAENEPLFIKQFPSAFFATSLDKWLHEQGIDTLFICGFSTSGCVRASALDALQYGFIPFVVANACADRSDDIHSQNLRDLGAKYGEIVVTDQLNDLLP